MDLEGGCFPEDESMAVSVGEDVVLALEEDVVMALEEDVAQEERPWGIRQLG